MPNKLYTQAEIAEFKTKTSDLIIQLNALINNEKYRNQKAYFEWLLKELMRVQEVLLKVEQSSIQDLNAMLAVTNPFVFKQGIPDYPLPKETKDKILEPYQQWNKELSREDLVALHIFGGLMVGVFLAVASLIIMFILTASTGGLGFGMGVFMAIIFSSLLTPAILGIGTGLINYEYLKNKRDVELERIETDLDVAKKVHPSNVEELDQHKTFLHFFQSPAVEPKVAAVDDKELDAELSEIS